MYNLDADGYPAPGAPSNYFGGEYGGKRYEKVCTLCYQMKDTLSDRDYWRCIQDAAEIVRKARMDKFQNGGGNVI